MVRSMMKAMWSSLRKSLKRSLLKCLAEEIVKRVPVVITTMPSSLLNFKFDQRMLHRMQIFGFASFT